MRWVLGLVVIATPVWAEDAGPWTALDGAAIAALLTGQVLDFTGGWQRFEAGGGTTYDAGSPSHGYWRIRGDRYCSSWPPSASWACHDISVQGRTVRFTGDGGGADDGVLRP